MDHQQRLSEVFNKFSQRDAIGFLRAAAHALADYGVDDLVTAIRGAPAEPPAVLPPSEPPALPAASEAVQLDARTLALENGQLRARLATLEEINRGLQDTIAKVSRERDAAAAELRARPAASEETTAAPGADLIDIREAATIVGVSVRSIVNLLHQDFPRPVSRRGRANLWRREDVRAWAHQREAAKAGRAKPGPQETARDAEKAAAMDRAIEYEDSVPEAAQSAKRDERPDDLLVSGDVRALLGLKSTSALSVIKRRDPAFPKPVGRRGNAETYRRSEIDAWLAERPPVARGKKPRRLRRSDGNSHDPQNGGQAPAPDWIDIAEVAAMLSEPGKKVHRSLIDYHRRRNGFPEPAATVRCKHYWHKAEVEAWIKNWRARRRASVGADRRKPPRADVKTKTCGTCADCKTVGRFSVCASDSGPHRNTTRQPTDRCEFHRTPGNYRPVRPDDED